jgi:hypothetical protein
MRIKIIGDNNCARATRHLLRKAGFAVTEFLPADVVTHAPHFGYVITIDLAPAPHAPDPADVPYTGTMAGMPTSKPDHSAPASAAATAGPTADAEAAAGSPAAALAKAGRLLTAKHGEASPLHGGASSPTSSGGLPHPGWDKQAQAAYIHSVNSHIHFDSVDSELEAAILRHVTQLAASPVVVDRPGGVVHSERELRIIVPNSGGTKADEAAAVAVEFGVLRGFLDLTSPPSLPKMRGATAGEPVGTSGSSRTAREKKWWAFFLWPVIAVLALTGSLQASPRRGAIKPEHIIEERPVDRGSFLLAAALAAQGQFVTGQSPVKITDGTNNLVIDPCKGQTKLYVSINQTANAQLVAGTASKKIYICSIHVVVAVATNAAVVEGTGSVCATGTAGVSGFGGATAATGWNFAANGGIALGNGDAAVGAEGTNADNLCLFNSGAGQVSGGISYVVQ